MRSWDSRDQRFSHIYDTLRRPVDRTVCVAGGAEKLLGRVVYGDLLASPAASNYAGRVYRVYDGAGVATTQAFDFKGHPTSEQRQFVTGKTTESDWSALLGQSTIAAMATAAAPLLDAEVFSAASERDALGRVLKAISLDNSEVFYSYDEGGGLQKVELKHRGSATAETVVGDITYNFVHLHRSHWGRWGKANALVNELKRALASGEWEGPELTVEDSRPAWVSRRQGSRPRKYATWNHEPYLLVLRIVAQEAGHHCPHGMNHETANCKESSGAAHRRWVERRRRVPDEVAMWEEQNMWEIKQGPGCHIALRELLESAGGHDGTPLAELVWEPVACGLDEYGLWVSLAVGSSRQRFRWVVGGSFVMGVDSNERPDDGPSHVVTLTRGFWLTDTPCTQGLWAEVMGENPGLFFSLNRPVEGVTWYDTQRFFGAMSRRVPGFGGRLPTEAEWEYACRAGGEAEGDLGAVAWYGENSFIDWDLPSKSMGTHPVALKRPNRWGLFDMLGNIEEWCSDDAGQYTEDPVADPRGPSESEYRVFRGGDWLTDASHTCASCRYSASRTIAGTNIGFRICCSVGNKPDGE